MLRTPSFAIFLCAVALTVMPAEANLLNNPGFEGGPGALFPGGSNILVSSNVSAPYTSGYTTGVWGAENATAITTSTLASVPPPTPQVINPNSGSYMLDMSGFSTGTDTQAWQLIDVSAFQSAINTGNVTLDFSAYFNAPFFVGSTGLANQPIALLGIQYYPASYLNTYQRLDTPGVSATISSQVIATDTWTNESMNGLLVPTGTSYILAQVGFDNSSLTDPASVDYDGYVDNASLTLNNVPEPTSVGVLSAAGLCCLLRRRRNRMVNRMRPA